MAINWLDPMGMGTGQGNLGNQPSNQTPPDPTNPNPNPAPWSTGSATGGMQAPGTGTTPSGAAPGTGDMAPPGAPGGGGEAPGSSPGMIGPGKPGDKDGNNLLDYLSTQLDPNKPGGAPINGSNAAPPQVGTGAGAGAGLTSGEGKNQGGIAKFAGSIGMDMGG